MCLCVRVWVHTCAHSFCVMWCLAAFLASTHKISLTPLPSIMTIKKNVTKHWQMPFEEAESPPTEKRKAKRKAQWREGPSWLSSTCHPPFSLSNLHSSFCPESLTHMDCISRLVSLLTSSWVWQKRCILRILKDKKEVRWGSCLFCLGHQGLTIHLYPMSVFLSNSPLRTATPPPEVVMICHWY